jgi:hypothetical protein
MQGFVSRRRQFNKKQQKDTDNGGDNYNAAGKAHVVFKETLRLSYRVVFVPTFNLKAQLPKCGYLPHSSFDDKCGRV